MVKGEERRKKKEEEEEVVATFEVRNSKGTGLQDG